MKKFITAVLFATVTCSANWSYESGATLKRIADALEKIEKHLAENCETPKATPVSYDDSSWMNYRYVKKNANHPLKAKPTHDEADAFLMRCVDKCGDLYDKDEDRLTKCLEDCVDRY